jgi:hypothetical protein
MRSLAILIVLFLVGCANTQMVETNKRETEYRKSLLNAQGSNQRDQILLETVEERSYTEEVLRCEHYMKKINRGTPEEELVFDSNSCQLEEVQRVRATPIEMPQEWLNQWPSLRDPNYVEPEQVEVPVITDPCEQLGPAYC